MQFTVDEINVIVSGRNRCGTRQSVRGVTTDSRTVQPGQVFVAICGEHHDGHDHVHEAFARGAVAAIVQNEVSGTAEHGVILVDNTVAALGQLATAHRARLRARVVAITGSNGKTTVKEMIGHVLAGAGPCVRAKRSFNNHLGVPLTLLQATQEHTAVVLELGSNAPGEIAMLAAIARPDVAVITGIGSAHLAGFRNLNGVMHEKLSLLDHLEPDGHAVVNIDAPDMTDHLPSDCLLTTTGLRPDADIHAQRLWKSPRGIHVLLQNGVELTAPLLGQHNGLNLLSAYAAARACGIDQTMIVDRLATTPQPPMRLETQRFGHLTVINDCYNANPTSTLAALDVLEDFDVSGRRVAILGDMGELGIGSERMHAAIGERIGRGKIDLLLGVGAMSYNTCVAARKAGRVGLQSHAFSNLSELRSVLAELLQSNDTVLLKASRSGQLERLLEPLEEFGRHHGETPSALRTL